ncbi:MAG: hypothetical protein AUK47_15225 [Deltaproteobacteria bacterium CG2_30_63_29]|nr:MAG: hypothetical protein AUK47_15225 [Deltaproteobacteria bacterium CG2_30_63_29]PJB37841.1 MAG: hypothetical protein CO108_20325 [Deltaproteobacteria bacterium CG_4_9_14_3_um_filter_63_12]
MKNLFTRRFDRLVRLAVTVLGGALVFGVGFSLYALWPSNQAVGYEPVQPVPFSHKRMAGDNKIPCLYCHDGAERGPVAGLPTVEVCMNCHTYVQPKDKQGNLTPGMQALFEYVDPATNKPTKPIVWEKIHDLSDFAYFDHSRHTVGARLPCADCHGPVETMDQVYQVNSLKMGWCLDCHTKPPEPWRTDGRATRGPTQCTSCHR